MPDELEERLERTLGGLEPGADVTECARAAALGALPPPRTRSRKPLVLVAAACAVAFVFGGVTLAATGGGLPLVGGGTEPDHPHGTETRPHRRPGIVLPNGAVAFAAAANGRVWLSASSGTQLQGMPATAYGLSPGAIWSIVGAKGGVRAVGVQQHGQGFSHAVAGTPVAAAWAPAGIRIAYVVRTTHGGQLFDMYGNGTHDFPVARHVASVTPSWRWDSQAFAYVSARGRVMVHNAIAGSTAVLPRACGVRRPAAVAYAPFGGLLAIADAAGRVQIVDTLHGGPTHCDRGQPGAPSIAWVRPRQVIVGSGEAITRYNLYGRFAGADVTNVPGTVAGLAAGMDGRRLALAIRDSLGDVQVVEARTPRFSSAAYPLRVYRLLLRIRHTDGPVALSWQ
ncbi:MAG TPA: hypothetical protein VFW14_20660 [Gaiellales bacterium]|nr:hypothetical protein [Gaiellales bacterium]